MLTVEQENHADKCNCKKESVDGKTMTCDCDGYHTFTELYDHRSALFVALCNMAKFISWKSRFHADGTMFTGMFIASTDTPEGPATYHLDEKWWDEMKCLEMDTAPEWDGHTSDDVLERLKSIK